MGVSAKLDRRVRERAKGVCEYCQLSQVVYPLTFEVDHVIAEQHHGKAQFNNLCLACPQCNRNKGPNIVHHKRVTTEHTEGHGKGKLIRILFSVYFGGFRG